MLTQVTSLPEAPSAPLGLVPRERRLRDFSLFDGVDPGSLDELESASQRRSAEKGKILYLPGDPPDATYFVVSGRVKVSRLSDSGKELILEIVAPGQFFGETGVLDERPRETIAEVLEPATLIVVPAARFRRVLDGAPELVMRLLRVLGGRQQQLERRLLGVVTKSARERLSELLLDLAETHGVRDARGTLLRIKLSQSAIGSLLGVSREIVNHSFAELKRRGVIQLSGGRVIIRNREALAEIAA